MSKIILITGTSSGFGNLMVKTLAADGHSVIAAMRGVNGKNAEVAQELNSIDNVEVVELDVTSEQSVNDAVQKTLKKYGQIDVLVNNAGVNGFGVLEATSVDQIKRLFDTNLFGTVRTYQAVLPSMREHKSGLVINISSGLGLFSSPYLVPYNMSKFAIQGLTEGIRQEVKRFGIENVTILPGPFPTEVGSKGGFNADREDIVAAYGPQEGEKLQQFGSNMFSKITEYNMQPQEVADAVKKLIDMAVGTRPFETAVNRIGEGVDQEFADSKRPYYEQIMKNLGWGDTL